MTSSDDQRPEGPRSDDPFDRPPNESGRPAGGHEEPTAPIQPGASPGAYPGASPGSETASPAAPPTAPQEGYWERQAREQQADQPYTQPAQQQWAPPPPPYGAAPQGYGGPVYGGQPAGYAGGYGFQPAASHPSSTTALVLGLVGLIGGLMCGIGFLVSPFALFVGRKAVKEIDASNGQVGGRSNANAGFVLGIVGTVLLVLGILAVVGFVILAIVTSNASSDYSTY